MRCSTLGVAELHPGALARGEDDDGRGTGCGLTRGRPPGGVEQAAAAPDRNGRRRLRLRPPDSNRDLKAPKACVLPLHQGGPPGPRTARDRRPSVPAARRRPCTGACRVGAPTLAVAYGGVTSLPDPRTAPTPRTTMTPPATPPPSPPPLLAPRSPPRPPEHEARGGRHVALAPVHRRAVPRPRRRCPGRLGVGAGLARPRPRRRDVRGLRPRHHGRLPPLLHPRLVQGEPRRCKIALAVAGSHGDRGAGHPLGRRPPPAPRVQRPRGRPALAVALRRDRAARWSRACSTRTSAGCSTSSRPTRSATRPTCSRTATSSGSPRPSRSRRGLAARCRRCSAAC